MHFQVLPPKDLFHPVLPYRSKGPDGTTKLTFPLCRTCADLRLNTCGHSEEERALTGAWTHLDLEESLRQGYTILKAHEHWGYVMVQKGVNRKGGLFTRWVVLGLGGNSLKFVLCSYVDTFLKLKAQASGWPKWVLEGDEEQVERNKDQFIKLFEEQEGEYHLCTLLNTI